MKNKHFQNIDQVKLNYLPLSGGNVNGEIGVYSGNRQNRATLKHRSNGYGSGSNCADLIFSGSVGYDSLHELFMMRFVHRNGGVEGLLGVNTNYPQYPLHVVGDIYCTGKITSLGGVQSASIEQLSDKEITALKQIIKEREGNEREII